MYRKLQKNGSRVYNQMVRSWVYRLIDYYQDSNVCTKTEQDHGGGHLCNLKSIYFKCMVYMVAV